MKRVSIIVLLSMLSMSLFAQLDGGFVEGMVHNPNRYLGKQQKEIGNTIKAEVDAQVRAKRNSSSQSSDNSQSVQSFNNRISAEGQQRMEYYNNPDNYIDRSITNRGSSYGNQGGSYRPQSQPRGLRTQPIHSENLNSKSLQMLREANREQFSNDNSEWTIDPNAKISLFDAPSLGEYSMNSIEQKEMLHESDFSKDGEIWDELRSMFDEIQIQGIANAMKSTNNGELPVALGINDKGAYVFESKPSEADLDDDGHYDRVYAVSPDGVLTYATFDEHFFKDDNIIEMIQNGEIKNLIKWDKKIGNSFNLTDLKNHPEKLEEIKAELKLSLFDNTSTMEVKRIWFAGKDSAANALAPDNSSYYIGIGGGMSSGLKATAKVGVSAALTNPHFKPTFSAGITATEVKAVGQFGTIQKIGNQFLQCDRTFQLKGSTNIDYRLYKILSIKGGYSLGCKIITTPENKFPSNKR